MNIAEIGFRDDAEKQAFDAGRIYIPSGTAGRELPSLPQSLTEKSGKISRSQCYDLSDSFFDDDIQTHMAIVSLLVFVDDKPMLYVRGSGDTQEIVPSTITQETDPFTMGGLTYGAEVMTADIDWRNGTRGVSFRPNNRPLDINGPDALVKATRRGLGKIGMVISDEAPSSTVSIMSLRSGETDYTLLGQDGQPIDAKERSTFANIAVFMNPEDYQSINRSAPDGHRQRYVGQIACNDTDAYQQAIRPPSDIIGLCDSDELIPDNSAVEVLHLIAGCRGQCTDNADIMIDNHVVSDHMQQHQRLMDHSGKL